MFIKSFEIVKGGLNSGRYKKGSKGNNPHLPKKPTRDVKESSVSPSGSESSVGAVTAGATNNDRIRLSYAKNLEKEYRNKLSTATPENKPTTISSIQNYINGKKYAVQGYLAKQKKKGKLSKKEQENLDAALASIADMESLIKEYG